MWREAGVATQWGLLHPAWIPGLVPPAGRLLLGVSPQWVSHSHSWGWAESSRAVWCQAHKGEAGRRAHSLSLGSCFSFRASSPSPRGQGGLTPASCHLLPPWRKPPSLENPGCAETGGTRSDLPMSIQALCLFFSLVVWGHLVVELQELFYIVWISTSY